MREQSDVSAALRAAVPVCTAAISEEARAAGVAAMRRFAAQHDSELDRRCYVLEEQAPQGQHTIELSQSVLVDSDFNRSGTHFVVLPSLSPEADATLRVSGLSAPPVGGRLLQVAGTALGIEVPAPESVPAEAIGQYSLNGYRTRVVPISLAPGSRVRIDGGGYGVEVDSMTTYGLVVGASVGVEFLVQGIEENRPIGALTETVSNTAMTRGYEWSAGDWAVAASASAFVGLRVDDWLIAPGILLVSTSGEPLQGASLRVGRRCRRSSRSVYYSVVLGLRWNEVPTSAASFPVATPPALLPTEMQFAGTLGFEFSFDIATVVGSPGGFVNALLGD